jgi:hypothetical protein
VGEADSPLRGWGRGTVKLDSLLWVEKGRQIRQSHSVVGARSTWWLGCSSSAVRKGCRICSVVGKEEKWHQIHSVVGWGGGAEVRRPVSARALRGRVRETEREGE